MSFRFSPVTTAVLVVVATVLMASGAWAYFYELGPSKDEWGLKYEGEATLVAGDKYNLSFTLADQGRLKPIYSVSVIAFSNPGRDGFRSYLLNSRIDLKPTKDGKLAGQVQVPKEFADRATVRILTQTFDNQPQTAGARYYDIPLRKFMKKPSAAPKAPASAALPPVSKVTK